MGIRGEAAIVGFVELAPERKPTRPPMLTLEQWARLAKGAIDDAGLHPRSVNGLVTSGIAESSIFVPATLSEYLGLPINFGEVVDLGGATSAGMVWRAAAAIELGLCDAVVCIATGQAVPRSKKRPAPPRDYFGSSSDKFGSPQAEFEIPLWESGTERPLRPDRPALRLGLRLRRAGHGKDLGRPAHQRLRHAGRHLLRPAHHGRRRAGQPDGG